jgi:hypothetical protein
MRTEELPNISLILISHNHYDNLYKYSILIITKNFQIWMFLPHFELIISLENGELTVLTLIGKLKWISEKSLFIVFMRVQVFTGLEANSLMFLFD